MLQPSIRSLARQLGLSAATVSLALRDSPRVVAATKRRVRQAAGRAGHQPNPLVRSVMAAMRRSAHDSFQGALMALNYTEEAVPVLNTYHREVFAGAEQRARELGYSMELCWVGPKQVSLARLNVILRARNVHGVVVLPFAEPRDFSELNWSSLAAVVMDYCLGIPAHHTVLPDHHLSIFQAMESLARIGYRRPGLVLARDKDERLMHRWSAGFASYARKQTWEREIPVLLEPGVTRMGFLQWFRRYRPDVVLGHVQKQIAQWLRDEGCEIPRDVGFVQLNWTERTAPCAGLNLQPALLGAAALESVVAQLQRNERGLPAGPKSIALTARWVDGPTLRSASRAVAANSKTER